MRYLAIISVLVLFASCKKNDVIDHQRMIVGDPVGMVVTPVNYTIQDSIELNNPQANVLLDIDGDGGGDIVFISQADSIQDPDPDAVYRVGGYVTNHDFEIVQHYESGITHRVITSITDDYFGTFPRKTIVYDYGCNLADIAESEYIYQTYQAANVVQSFEDGDYIFDGLNWYDNFGEFNLYVNSYTFEDCYFNTTMDSLICEQYLYPQLCESVPMNQEFYMVFKKNSNPIRYGWIKLKISNNNRLDIIESAIQH